jgi:hypothetical protein
MRFEVGAAFAIGILLPLLETCRRGMGYWFVEATTMLEDFVGGGLLLLAATLSTRGARTAPLWMLLAWASVTAMMTMSFIDQLEGTLRGADLEPHNELVLGIKFLLWAVCSSSLVLAFVHARPPAPPRGYW